MQVVGRWEGTDGLAFLTEVLIYMLALPLTLAPHFGQMLARQSPHCQTGKSCSWRETKRGQKYCRLVVQRKERGVGCSGYSAIEQFPTVLWLEDQS